MPRHKQIGLRLINLIRIDAKRLGRKILKQRRLIESDSHRARVLLTNAKLKVLRRNYL